MSPSSPAGSSSSSLPDSNALLALPDGPIPSSHPDRNSHLISIIGGYPTFPLPTPPPSTSFTCLSCTSPIPLLAQVYCPPEGGENDRTIYVFACPKGKCQRKNGSIRAWRASMRNEEYVRDVEARRLEKDKEDKKVAEERRKNPFTMGDAPSSSASLFGGGGFGASTGGGLFGATNPFAAPSPVLQATAVPDLSSLSLESTTSSVPEPSSSSLSPPHPSYQPPQYLATTDEYLPPPSEIDIDSDDEDGQTAEEKAEWRDERFEQLLPSGMDPLFERFVKRISEAEGASTQVLRYDLGGYPLPYSTTSSLTNQLFSGLPAALRAQKAEDDDPNPATFYTPSSKNIPSCPRCKSERVFELQLVPSLINHLSPETLSTTGDKVVSKGKKVMTEEERKIELARLAGEGAGGGGDGLDGMEWGTVVVFGCKSDCIGFGEEWVGVEWETTLDA